MKDKEKIFWTNFLSFIAIFLFFTITFAYTTEYFGEKPIGFLGAYIFTSAFCVLYLGINIGKTFMKYEEINEKTNNFLNKEKITIQEFREKYKDIIAIYDDSINMFDDIKKEENTNIYKFPAIIGSNKKVLLTLGYNDNDKCDIYWKDIVASRNNKKEIVDNYNNDCTIVISGFSPENSLDFVNKKCPFCGGNIDRFFYIDNFSENDFDNWGDTGWMEVCFKCKKPIYYQVAIE